jgi:hypothetical protein
MNLSSQRLLTLLVAATLACSAWSQALYLDGHKAVYDSRNNFWLCSVPQEVFNTDWSPVVEYDSTCTNVSINGTTVMNGWRFMFSNIKGGKKYPCSISTDSTVLSGNITFTWLPIIELYGDINSDYSEGTVSINGPDSTAKDDMRAKLKWRGHYSNTDNKHKRNYSIKFLDKDGEKKNRSFFGLRKDNHWKLDAGQADRLRVRNRVATELWLDMSTKPWYHDIEPELVNGSRGRTSELFLNGEYRGIYGLIEPVDRKQLKLIKHDTINNEFHGQLWFSWQWCRTGTMSDPKPWSNNSDMWDGIELDYPEFEDVHPTDWSTLANAITFVKRMDNVDNWTTLTDSIGYYFDLPVMLDYFVFIISLQALGNESINIYYSTYDKAQNCPLTMTAWDLDNTVGSKHFADWTANLYGPTRPLDWISNLAFNDLFYNTKYRKTMIDRYWKLRSTWLNTDSLIARYQRAVDELELCGASAREEALWSGDSDINGRTLDISDEMSYVANWIRQRMAYLDANVFAPETTLGDLNGDTIVDIEDVTELINHVLNGTGGYVTEGDMDGNGIIDIDDVISLIGMVLGVNNEE